MFYHMVRGRVVTSTVGHQSERRAVQMSGTSKGNNRPRSHLKRDQEFKIVALLREWQNELQQTRPAFAVVADRLSTALKFTVSPGNVRGIAADMGIHWRVVRTARPRPANLGRIARIEHRIELLRNAFLNLAEQMGASAPADLAADRWSPADAAQDPPNS